MSEVAKTSGITYGDLLNSVDAASRQAEATYDAIIKSDFNASLVGYPFTARIIRIENCESDYRHYARIHYHYEMDKHSDISYAVWEHGKTYAEVLGGILRKLQFIYDMRKKHPALAELNEYVQKHRMFEMSARKMPHGEHTVAAELCTYFKYPYTTDCSVGGGDSSFLQTPERARDFVANIDILIGFYADCIKALNKLKVEMPDGVQ